MKLFGRLVARYVLIAVGILLFLLFLAAAMLIALGFVANKEGLETTYRSSQVASALKQEGRGFSFDAGKSPAEWMQGYEWAMVLDDGGNVIWQYGLPDALNHPYTAREIAAFSKWFLDGYPVFSWVEDYGLFVIGMSQGSLWRLNLYNSASLIRAQIRMVKWCMVALPLLLLLLFLLISWRSSRQLMGISVALDQLAEGNTVRLVPRGITAQLAEKLNQTGAQLQRRNEIIARRDAMRTEWIAGVSHDIRTPLSLILGWAQQLQSGTLPQEAVAGKAAGVQIQAEKIRALIEDLNLTSKLQYGTQPLGIRPHAAGSLLRKVVAAFYDDVGSKGCEIDLAVADSAEQARLNVDEALFCRCMDNLLGNSVRHNARPVRIHVECEASQSGVSITVTDDGVGYPPRVLLAMEGASGGGDAPHILGLHVVRQIVRAHGGSVEFAGNIPHGARTRLVFGYDQNKCDLS